MSCARWWTGITEISVRRQCELLGVNRSSVVLRAGGRERREPAVDAVDGRAVHADAVFRKPANDGVAAQYKEVAVNRKRISRLMEVMGIEAVYPKPKLSQPGEGHKIYPYLLRGRGS